MASASELKRLVKTLLGVALVALAVIWLSGSLPTAAVAEPSLAPVGPSLENARRERPRITARFASHHEEEEDEDEGEPEENDDGEEDEIDFDFELMELEVERVALQTYFGGLELIEKIGHMAADDDLAAVLALTTVTDEFDLPESKLLEFLKEVANKSPSKAAQRVAVMKIAEIHNERGDADAALRQVRRILRIPSR